MSELTRRDILGSAALVGGLYALTGQAHAQQASGGADGPYTLPDLPYGYADLEPHISAQIMKLHHDVHHAGYVKGANEALAALDAVRRTGGDEIKKVRNLTDALTFNLAGHVLHSIFWKNMAKAGGGEPKSGSEIGKLIQRDFGSYAAFNGHFSAAAMQVQGSGWGILAWEPLAQRLVVLEAEKHQVNVVSGTRPLIALDVWEHEYYLQYQQKRADYIKAFFNVISWDDVEQRLQTTMK